jgi:hypothetical protein
MVAERLDLGGMPVLVAELDFDPLVQARQMLVNARTPPVAQPVSRWSTAVSHHQARSGSGRRPSTGCVHPTSMA